MAAPTSAAEFLELVQKSGVIEAARLAPYLEYPTTSATQIAERMVKDAVLTYFQAEQLLLGKWKRFTIGKYKVLERLGAGGMGQVFLCEHMLMRRRVAVKVLPTVKAEDPAALERFYREARAVAALDHPNLVRAHDIDQDQTLHFLVMEYVDGLSLQDLVKRSGPLDPVRACHYVVQACDGLQYAHEVANLVHRDVKPGNILVDRTGVVKVLDLGLARFFNDEDDVLTRKYDENTLGTADYLAPEQAVDSHSVDVRADIYSLGATLYYMLTGSAPFAEGTVAQKLIWHQTRQPKSIRYLRPEVPEGVAAALTRMMMKDPAARYQSPAEVAAALAPYTTGTVPPPSEDELPRLSPAALAVSGNTAGVMTSGKHAIPRAALAQRMSSATASSAMHVPLQTVAASAGNGNGHGTQPPLARLAGTGPNGARRPVNTRDDSNPFAPLLTGSGNAPPLEQSAQHVYATAAARAANVRLSASARAGSDGRVSIWVVIAAAILSAAAGYTIWQVAFPNLPKRSIGQDNAAPPPLPRSF